MSIHISAKKGEIAPFVLLPGDPLRAEYMARTFLKNVIQVNKTRNALYFTGTYNETAVTIGASGMGCPSIGIYSYELYDQFDVECIIRVGTCGAYKLNIKLFQLINVEMAYSESTYAESAFGFKEDHMQHQGKAYTVINETAKRLKMDVMSGPIHSGDAFYRKLEGLPPIAVKNDLLAAEMEAFALFANARVFGKMAATLLTVSDIIGTHQLMSADERETKLDEMAKLALESVVALK